MIKQLSKVGNSSALVLDKALMELLGLTENGKVQLKVQDGALIVMPVDPQAVDREKFEAALNRVVTKRRSVLRKLAQ